MSLVKINSSSAQPQLRDLVLHGLDEYLANSRFAVVDQIYRDRANAELDKIDFNGLAPFFIAAKRLSDLLQRKGFRCKIRPGKASGALVTRCLGLSNVDPIALGLFFEPFLCGGISSPCISFAVEPQGMEPAKELLERISHGRLVRLDDQVCVAWGQFPSNCPEPVAFKGIACRFRFPMIVLSPSERAAIGEPNDYHVQDWNFEEAAALLILAETDGRIIGKDGHGPECLAEFLAQTHGVLLYYEQLWTILIGMFNLNVANAELVAFALCRGGDRAGAAQRQLSALSAVDALPANVRDTVIDYICRRALTLNSRAYFVSAALSA